VRSHARESELGGVRYIVTCRVTHITITLYGVTLPSLHRVLLGKCTWDVLRVATGLGLRSFVVAGPKAWYSLQFTVGAEMHCVVDLKAELFSRAYGVSINI